jgi:hypothetical protein
MHNYSPVLDQIVRSGPAFSQTGLDCSLRALDHIVQSFYPSPFLTGRKTRLNSPVQYFWNQTIVQRYWTVQSSLFKWSPKKSTVQTGLDCGQSTYYSSDWSLASLERTLGPDFLALLHLDHCPPDILISLKNLLFAGSLDHCLLRYLIALLDFPI